MDVGKLRMLTYGCFALRCSTHHPAGFGKMLTNTNMYIVLPFSFDYPQTGQLLSSCSQAYQQNVVVFLTFSPYELLYRWRPTNRRIIVLGKGHFRKEDRNIPRSPVSLHMAYQLIKRNFNRLIKRNFTANCIKKNYSSSL